MVGGALAGIAGAAFSLDVKLGWREVIDELGWIALAIVIFGGWNLVRAAFGAYLFGVLARGRPCSCSLAERVAILALLPFPLMIFALVLVYLQCSATSRPSSDLAPAAVVRSTLGLGVAFHRE